MIERLVKKNLIDIINLVSELKDQYEDFYFTIDKSRLFIKDNRKLIKKLLISEECYGYFEDGLKGLLIIYRSKGFRPYLKILALNDNIIDKLMKYFVWNRNELDIFCKLKLENPIIKIIKKYGFFPKGDRGKEVLLFKKGFKTLTKILPKDYSLDEKENRLY